jgi:hypothetical protein
VRAQYKFTLKTPSGEQTIECSPDTYILDVEKTRSWPTLAATTADVVVGKKEKKREVRSRSVSAVLQLSPELDHVSQALERFSPVAQRLLGRVGVLVVARRGRERRRQRSPAA